MPAAKQAEDSSAEKYKIMLSLWRKERIQSRQEFLGFIIATVILALVSLSGTWWPPLFGILVSMAWLVLSIKSASQKEYLYQEMETISAGESANPLFQVHRFEQAEVIVPFLGDITKLFQPVSRYLFLCAPATFTVIWVFGLLLSFFT
ncbi:hypothetical protein ACFLUG_02675 [Chloroflexota bacterium]